MKPYLANTWTGQYDSIRLYKTPNEKLTTHLSELSRAFDPKLHGSTLAAQVDPEFINNLQSRLNSYSLEISGVNINIKLKEKADESSHKVEPQKLRSAYAEDFLSRIDADESDVGLHGEMLASTVPIQDPYAVTVDYLLYSSIT